MTETPRAKRMTEVLLAASHDLRAPMSTILLWERVLRERAETAEVRERALSAIRESALSATALIGEMADVLSLLAGVASLVRERVEVEPMLHTAIELTKDAAADKRLQLVRDYQSPLGHVLVDGERFRRALGTLVQHAIEIASPGKTITIGARRQRGALWLSIGDVVRQRDADEVEMSTLQLCVVLVKELVTLHGGRLEMTRSSRGGMWTLHVRLPQTSGESA